MAMAYTCDVCGTTRDVESHFLQWNDDEAWSAELCPKHLAGLHRDVEKLLSFAEATTPRRARHYRREATGQAAYDAATGVDIAEVRAWAQAKNIPVSGRGRVAADVIEQWRKAHKK